MNSGFPDRLYFSHHAAKSLSLYASGESISIAGAPARQTSIRSAMGPPMAKDLPALPPSDPFAAMSAMETVLPSAAFTYIGSGYSILPAAATRPM